VLTINLGWSTALHAETPERLNLFIFKFSPYK